MPIDPELAAALRTQLRRPAIAWLVVMVAAGAGYGGLHYAHQQAQQAQLTLQAQQSALQQELAQTEADLQLVLRHRADYQRWQADGLIGPLPVAEWRAQQLQALAQALQTLGPWASERVTLQMQPSRALVPADAPNAASAAPDPAATPGENPSAPPTTVHSLSIQGRGTDDQLPDSDPNAGVELNTSPLPNTGCNLETLTRPVVPWRALGLTADDAVDAWGTRITYRPWMTNAIANRSLTTNAINCASVTGKPLKARPPTGSGSDAWQALLTNAACQVTPPNNNPGHRVLTKVTGASSLANPGTSTNGKTGAAYVLISHGPNQCGGYKRSGVFHALAQCVGTAASTDEQRNFNNSLSQSNGAGQGYVDRPYDESPSRYFDDIVRWRTIMQLAVEAKKVN